MVLPISFTSGLLEDSLVFVSLSVLSKLWCQVTLLLAKFILLKTNKVITRNPEDPVSKLIFKT